MSIIAMELRLADVGRREIVGVVAPYDQVTHLVPDPGGEVLMRGAFTKSITDRPTKIPLFLNHDHGVIYGFSSAWEDAADKLVGVFKVRDGDAADQLLIDARDGYLPGMSIDFKPVQSKRRSDGVVVVREAKLAGVSLVTIPAYDAATVLATRAADFKPIPRRIDVAKMFGPAPIINLSPLPPFWH